MYLEFHIFHKCVFVKTPAGFNLEECILLNVCVHVHTNLRKDKIKLNFECACAWDRVPRCVIWLTGQWGPGIYLVSASPVLESQTYIIMPDCLYMSSSPGPCATQAFYHLGISPAQAPLAHTAPLFYLASDSLATYSVNSVDNFDPTLDSQFRVGNRHALETEVWRSLLSQQVTEDVVRPFKCLKITVSKLWKAQARDALGSAGCSQARAALCSAWCCGLPWCRQRKPSFSGFWQAHQ